MVSTLCFIVTAMHVTPLPRQSSCFWQRCTAKPTGWWRTPSNRWRGRVLCVVCVADSCSLVPSISVLTCALCQIEHHPRFAQLLRYRPFFRQHTSLGMFGAASAKPVKLFSSSNFIQFLYRRLNRAAVGPSNTTRRHVRGGRTYFTGTRHLRESQVYPPAFGRQARCLSGSCAC